MDYTPLPLKPFKYVLIDLIEFTLAFWLLKHITTFGQENFKLPDFHWLIDVIVISFTIIAFFIFKNYCHKKFAEIISVKYPKIYNHEPTYAQNMLINFALYALALVTMFYVFIY